MAPESTPGTHLSGLTAYSYQWDPSDGTGDCGLGLDQHALHNTDLAIQILQAPSLLSLRNPPIRPYMRCNGLNWTRRTNMNWLPEGLDKLDKNVALFVVAAGAIVAMYVHASNAINKG